jgi:hypothetical protein
LKTVSDVIEEFARKTALNQEIRIERNKVGILGKINEILSGSLRSMVKNFTKEDVANIVEGSILLPLSDAFLEYYSHSIAETLTHEQEKAKIDAKIISALVNGKILSSNELDDKTTTEDKVKQLSEWVTGEFSPEKAHALTFERCMAESVLHHLKYAQENWETKLDLEKEFVRVIEQKILDEHLAENHSRLLRELKIAGAGCVISKKKFICCGSEISSLHLESVAIINRSLAQVENVTSVQEGQDLGNQGHQEVETDTHSLLGTHNDPQNPSEE